MSNQRHGLTIGIEQTGNDFFLSFKAAGKLTHEDYEKITPMLDAALQTVDDPKVKMLADISELEGWELRAAWDDFKLGLKHGSEFEYIAIVGSKKWQNGAARIGSWFISGEMKSFDATAPALAWLQNPAD